jgi:TRAP transporter 4TM/12TM fusion protein
MKHTYTALAVLLSLFVLLAVNLSVTVEETIITAVTNRLVFSEISNLALFAMLGLLLVFANKPLLRKWADAKWPKIINWMMMAATIAVFGYIFIQSDEKFSSFWVEGTLLGDRAGDEKTIDFVIAGIGLVLILDGTRRAIGWTLPILCFLFAAYAMFGQSMPDALFPHAGNTWQQIVQKTFLQDGVFGIALSVMFKYVFLFVLFGALLEQTGATGYVINFARRIFRNSTGGPAKIAVLSSGLMGSLSGSAVANTAATGTFTIPLMKSSGFKSDTAGGVEAAASAGGALMPPIMGAGAYMMLEMVQPAVNYLEIIKAALIPAILYYFALLMTVHFHSKNLAKVRTVRVTKCSKKTAKQLNR